VTAPVRAHSRGLFKLPVVSSLARGVEGAHWGYCVLNGLQGREETATALHSHAYMMKISSTNK
jgi:hypothetical protein